MKIGPFFSSVGHMAHRLVAAGADGLVLFNRFMQPDIDLETLTVDPRCTCRLRRAAAAAAMDRDPARPRACIASPLTTGCHTAEDALKSLLVGADVAMMASALLAAQGPGHLGDGPRRGLEAWLDEHDYESVAQMRGSMSQRNVPNPVAFARSNYAQLVTSFVSPYDWRLSEPEGELQAIVEPPSLVVVVAGCRPVGIVPRWIPTHCAEPDLRRHAAHDRRARLASWRSRRSGYPGYDPAHVRASAPS